MTPWEGPGDTQLDVVDPVLTKAKLLHGGPDPLGSFSPLRVTSDGRHAVFDHCPVTPDRSQYGIYTTSLDGKFEPKPLHISETIPADSRLSPDGQWLAYKELFPNQQVFVQPFSLDEDQLDSRVVIPNAKCPRWSADGTELLYLHPESFDVMVVRVTNEPELALSKPEKILHFDSMYAATFANSLDSFEVLPDGRFVYIGAAEDPNPQLHFVQNIDVELERRLRNRSQ